MAREAAFFWFGFERLRIPMSKSLVSLLLPAVLLAVQLPALASVEKLQEMSALFDKLDREDFLEGLEKAEACTARRDFSCADAELLKVEKLVNGRDDRQLWDLASANRAAEQARVTEEARQREALQQRLEQEAEEREEQARQLAWEQQQQEERAQAARESEANMKGMVAILGAAALSSGMENYSEAQRRAVVDAYVTDVAYDTGGSNLDAAVDEAIAQRQGEHEEQLRQIDEQHAAAQRQQADQLRQAILERRAEEAREAARQRPVAEAPRAPAAPEFPKYQPQVVTLPEWPQTCPEGSSPMRHPNGRNVSVAPGAICVRDPGAAGTAGTQASAGSGVSGSGDANSGAADGTDAAELASATQAGSSAGERDDPATAMPPASAPKVKEVEQGPVLLEAIAICRQNSKNRKWECNGALDNQTYIDELSVESALARQHCEGGVLTVGGPVLDGVQWTAYQCGHSLGAGDYDVAKRYNLVTPRRSYRCPKSQAGRRCAELYSGPEQP